MEKLVENFLGSIGGLISMVEVYDFFSLGFGDEVVKIVSFMLSVDLGESLKIFFYVVVVFVE